MRSVTTQLIRQLSAATDRRTDGELLDGFLTRNAEADFAELVRRYGSMVWGVCRRALPDRADAEDAFQTVFLVLVRRGNKLVGLPTVGPWLHRVAVWTARNVRRRNAHRLAKRVTLTEALPATTPNRDLSLDLDAALLALPEKFRSSIVLCHLLGFSRADAAAQLGCPEGTLSAWLSRGLAKLRTKLGDLDPARTLGIAAVAVPAGLSGSVVRAAVAFHATAATAMASALSSAIPQLVEGVIRMFWMKKATAATVALFAVFAFGVGVGVSTYQLAPAVGGQDNPALAKSKAPTESPDKSHASAEVIDSEIILSDLEQQRQKTEQDYKLTMEWLNRAQDKVTQYSLYVIQQRVFDPKDLEKALDDLAKARAQAKEVSMLRDKINEAITRVKEVALPLPKAQQNQKGPPEKPLPNAVQFTAPQVAPNDLDKKLAELKKLQAELQMETVNFKLNEAMLQLKLKKIADEITVLQKQKEASAKGPTATGAAYFQLTVGTKDAAWPFQIKEFDLDGKAIGTTAFENSAVLGRFLARAMKDPTAPKEVRFTAQANTPREMLAAAIEVCKAAGAAQTLLKSGTAPALAEELDVLIRKTATEARELEAVKEWDALKLREALDMKRKTLEDLKQKDEMERIYRDAIRQAEELLKKQKQDDPTSPQKR